MVKAGRPRRMSVMADSQRSGPVPGLCRSSVALLPEWRDFRAAAWQSHGRLLAERRGQQYEAVRVPRLPRPGALRRACGRGRIARVLALFSLCSRGLGLAARCGGPGITAMVNPSFLVQHVVTAAICRSLSASARFFSRPALLARLIWLRVVKPVSASCAGSSCRATAGARPWPGRSFHGGQAELLSAEAGSAGQDIVSPPGEACGRRYTNSSLILPSCDRRRKRSVDRRHSANGVCMP